jgi:hypothetical protein
MGWVLASMTIYRMAEKADAPELAILRWGLKAGDDPMPDTGKADFVRKFIAWMNASRDDDIVHWVAEQNGHLVGVISVRLIHKCPRRSG